MSKVIFINPFEIPQEQEDKYLMYLDEGYKIRKQQPGFISSRLHRAISPSVQFQFITVSEWQSLEHLQAALTSKDFKASVKPEMRSLPHYPGIYKIIRT